MKLRIAFYRSETMSLDTYTQNIPLTQKARCVKMFLISASELPHTKELLTLLIAGSGPTMLPPSRVRFYSCCGTPCALYTTGPLAVDHSEIPNIPSHNSQMGHPCQKRLAYGRLQEFPFVLLQQKGCSANLSDTAWQIPKGHSSPIMGHICWHNTFSYPCAF